MDVWQKLTLSNWSIQCLNIEHSVINFSHEIINHNTLYPLLPKVSKLGFSCSLASPDFIFIASGIMALSGAMILGL
jgi:hypothetical protein